MTEKSHIGSQSSLSDRTDWAAAAGVKVTRGGRRPGWAANNLYGLCGRKTTLSLSD